MGLAERRAMKEFETTHYPPLKQRIDAAAHFEVAVEVKWDTLMGDGYSHLFGEAWPKVYFEPLVKAFENICVDDMGREALREKLKKVVIQNSNSTASGSRVAAFHDGVLTLDHKPFTNMDDVRDRIAGIQKTLEAAL